MSVYGENKKSSGKGAVPRVNAAVDFYGTRFSFQFHGRWRAASASIGSAVKASILVLRAYDPSLDPDRALKMKMEATYHPYITSNGMVTVLSAVFL